MRVLFLTNVLPDSRNPARGIFIQKEIQALQNSGINGRIINIQQQPRTLNYFTFPVRLQKIIQQDRFDVIHSWYGLSAFSASFQNQLPLISTFLGSDLYLMREKYFSLWGAQKAAVRLVRSAEMQKLLPGESHIMPHGVDCEKFKPLDKKECGVVLRSLFPNIPDEFAIFGGNPDRPEKNYSLAHQSWQIFQQKTGSRLPLLPLKNIAPEFIPCLINASSLVLLTSKWEGSPNVIKEALACNKPVVSTAAGDVPYLLNGVNGTAVTGYSADEIAGKIQKLYKAGASEGRKRIFEIGYTLQQTTQKMVSLYQKMC